MRHRTEYTQATRQRSSVELPRLADFSPARGEVLAKRDRAFRPRLCTLRVRRTSTLVARARVRLIPALPTLHYPEMVLPQATGQRHVPAAGARGNRQSARRATRALTCRSCVLTRGSRAVLARCSVVRRRSAVRRVDRAESPRLGAPRLWQVMCGASGAGVRLATGVFVPVSPVCLLTRPNRMTVSPGTRAGATTTRTYCPFRSLQRTRKCRHGALAGAGPPGAAGKGHVVSAGLPRRERDAYARRSSSPDQVFRPEHAACAFGDVSRRGSPREQSTRRRADRRRAPERL